MAQSGAKAGVGKAGGTGAPATLDTKALVDAAIGSARTRPDAGRVAEPSPPPAPPTEPELPVVAVVSTRPGELVDAAGAPIDLATVWAEKTPGSPMVVARQSVYRRQPLPGSTRQTAVQVVAAGTEVPKVAALRLTPGGGPVVPA